MNPMGDGDLIWIGHYIDHELVSNIEKVMRNERPECMLNTISG